MSCVFSILVYKLKTKQLFDIFRMTRRPEMTRRQGTKPFIRLEVKCYRAGQASSTTGHHTQTGSGDHPPSYPVSNRSLYGMNGSELECDFSLRCIPSSEV